MVLADIPGSMSTVS